jgi:hypothetical protein
MRRLLACMTRLYPRWWRRRYEDEFRSFLAERQASWSDVLDVLKEATVMRVTDPRLILVTLFAGAGVISVLGYNAFRPLTHQFRSTISVSGVHDPGAFADGIRDALNDGAVSSIVKRHGLYDQGLGYAPEHVRVERFRANSGVILSREGQIMVYVNTSNRAQTEAAGRDMMNAVLEAQLPGVTLQLEAPTVLAAGRLPPVPRFIYLLAAVAGSIVGLTVGRAKRWRPALH